MGSRRSHIASARSLASAGRNTEIDSIQGLLTLLLSIAILVEVSSNLISGYVAYIGVLRPLQNIHRSIYSQGMQMFRSKQKNKHHDGA
jgi:hypothetical protein